MGLQIEYIETRDIFNLPIFEFYWIIDVRPEDSYKCSHIASAFNFPYDNLLSLKSDNEKVSLLAEFIQTNLHIGYLPPDRFSTIVVYGDHTKQSKEAINWLVEQLKLLKENNTQLCKFDTHLQIAPSPSSGSQTIVSKNDLTEFVNKIISHTTKVFLITNHYSSFYSKYPFLCHVQSIMDLYPLPHEIVDRLYMGSRLVNLGRALKDLHITHLIISNDHYRKLLQEHGAECLCNVCVLNGAVSDYQGDNIMTLWSTTHVFINEALECANNRVMILFEGRSRSASIVISWLVGSCGYSPESAINYVKRIANAIDTSLIFSEYLDRISNVKLT